MSASAKQPTGLKLSQPVKVFFRPHPDSFGGDSAIAAALQLAQETFAQEQKGSLVIPDKIFSVNDTNDTISRIVQDVLAHDSEDITSNLPTVLMACGVSGSGKSYTMVDLVVRWVQGQVAAPTGRLLYITIGALEHHKGNNGKGIERDMIEAIQKDSSVDRGSDGKRYSHRLEYGTSESGRVLACAAARVTASDLTSLLPIIISEIGEKRSTDSTILNASSSRSHCAYILRAVRSTGTTRSDGPCQVYIDLAGSERIDSGQTEGSKQETIFINRSLLYLKSMFRDLNMNGTATCHRSSSITMFLAAWLKQHARLAVIGTLKMMDTSSASATKGKANEIAHRKMASASSAMDHGTWQFGLCCKKAESRVSKETLQQAARSAKRVLGGRQIPSEGHAAEETSSNSRVQSSTQLLVETQTRLASAQDEITGLRRQLKKEVERAENAEEELEKEKEQTKKNIFDAKSRLNEKHSLLLDIKADIGSEKEQNTVLSQRVLTLEGCLDDACSKRDELEVECDRLQEELLVKVNKLGQEEGKSGMAVSSLQAALDTLKAQKGSVETKLNVVREQLQSSTEDSTQLKQDLRAAQTMVKKHLKDKQSVEQRLSTALGDLEDSHLKISTLKENEVTLSRNLVTDKSELGKSNALVKTIRAEAITEYAKRDKQIKALKKEVETVSAERDKLAQRKRKRDSDSWEGDLEDWRTAVPGHVPQDEQWLDQAIKRIRRE